MGPNLTPISEPATLSELLVQRADEKSGALCFLDDNGDISDTLTFKELLSRARAIAGLLLSQGLQGGGQDIVVANFDDQKTYILLFWGCCFARIPICPTPPLHPDPARRSSLLLHLNELFHRPVFVSSGSTLGLVKQHIPDCRMLDVGKLLDSSSQEGLMDLQPVAQANDTVALMLTSGSTGNSKGVILTHSALLSSIKGKCIKHGTGHQDAFFNWINFDHVANVTEAHLQAIWAGASQYQIFPGAVLRKPRNLLDWCSRYRITYTFSPNFLLGQICRDVTLNSPHILSDQLPDLSSLRAFVSGGEANPVRTAVEFTNILERCGTSRDVLRAGFGMTETGAGSIYNLDPIPKLLVDAGKEAYLSLGTPCQGLSMRVVDPDSHLPVAPNTPGQLQLKGSSVFPGYYANDTANKSAFTSGGWFITGDLALIDERGYLHMLGRSKDDINVNGVKHPSVDIEHHIEGSEIDGVVSSFVFVAAVRLPGADTESYAVFYKHATIDAESILNLTLNDVATERLVGTNREIRNACTVFCSQAPLAVLPLPAPYFVKTALGKVSRSALAKSYEQGKFIVIEDYIREASSKQSTLSNGRTMTQVEEILIEGVRTTFEMEMKTLDLSLNLFDIGATSMHLIRLKYYLQEALNLELPTVELLRRPVLQDLASYIQQISGGQSAPRNASYNPLVCLQPSGSKPPLFLIHPGVGEVLVFINLARVLDGDRPIFAIRARGFEAGEDPPRSMEEMVEIYQEVIQKQNPAGPYLLAGYSFGGIIAVEVGKALERQGKDVLWVGILNIPPFIQFRIRELVWRETFMNLLMFLSLISQDEFTSFKEALTEAYPAIESTSEPQNADEIVHWALKHSDQARLTELQLSEVEFRRWANITYCVSATGQTYEPSKGLYNTLTTVFCATPLPSMGTRETYKRDRLSKWVDFTGPHFEMIDVDGAHYTMLSEANYLSFASHMRSAILRAETLRLPSTIEKTAPGVIAYPAKYTLLSVFKKYFLSLLGRLGSFLL